MSAEMTQVAQVVASQLAVRREMDWSSYTVATPQGPVMIHDHSVPMLPSDIETPEQELQALQAALLKMDYAGITAKTLREIIPKYAEPIQLALLQHYWALIEGGLKQFQMRPSLVLGEEIERRLRVQYRASEAIQRDGKNLKETDCDVAFDDDAIVERADRGAKICREFCEALSRASVNDVSVVGAILRERARDESKAMPTWLSTPERGVLYEQIYRTLAQLVAEAKPHRVASDVDSQLLFRAYAACAAFARVAGLEPPLPGRQGMTLSGALQRLRDPRWWRRQLRKTCSRNAECYLRQMGLVSARKGLYVSELTYERCRKQRLRMDTYLSMMAAVNELGEVVCLKELMKSSISNPAIRRVELIVRMKGCEQYASDSGDKVLVCHISLPGRFHRIYKQSGGEIPHFDGSTPREGQQQLQESWAKVRAACARRNIPVYGFRIAEPCHDGTAHWHMMLCVSPDREQELCGLLRRYFLDELDPDQPGAQEFRVKFVPLDSERGSAIGYLIKYLSKGLDGEGVGEDAEDSVQRRDAKNTAQRATDHARVHGIRRFESVGLPPIGIWRELRRLRSPPKGQLAEFWRATEDQDFAAYMRHMGGPCKRAIERPVKLQYQKAKRPGQYGELNGRRLRGIVCGNVVVPTREVEWQLVRMPVSSPTWTCGNNCTDSLALIRDPDPESERGAEGLFPIYYIKCNKMIKNATSD